MTLTKIQLIFCCLLVFAIPFAYGESEPVNDETLEKAKKLFEPIPAKTPELKNNPTSPEKIELGKMLYFDPRLSSSALISCNTCHNLGLGGVDYQETSTGHGWQKGPRNAPTVLNSVFQIAQFWDGRAKDLMEQAKGPVQAAVEMNSKPEHVMLVLNSMPQYVELFKKAFSNDKEPVSFDNMAKAIESFEATLNTPDSPFDKYLKGDVNALNQEEKEGLKLFMDKGCSACHSGVNLGGANYQRLGIVKDPDAAVRPPDDKGRFTVTKEQSDEFVFKTPTLRNITLTAPYFHTGKIWSLAQAVSIMATVQLGADLTEQEVQKIVAFLKTTTGVQPVVQYPLLPAATDKTPRPKLN
jgi:cytochrome c peroxidase